MFSGLKFPANAMLVIKFMISVATFDLVPTGAIDDLIYYWPESDAFSVNLEMAGVESVFFLANILAMLVHAGIFRFRNISTCASKLH